MKTSKPNLPELPRGQKYWMRCCGCNAKILVRGLTNLESLGTDDGGSVSTTDFHCDRQTCGATNKLIITTTIDGVMLQWYGIKPNQKPAEMPS